MSVHSTDAFHHATELVGTEIWSFCQHAQFCFAVRRGLSWFSWWKSHHENAEKTQRHTRVLAAQFIDFLHTLEQCFPTSGSRPIGGSRSYFRWVAKHF